MITENEEKIDFLNFEISKIFYKYKIKTQMFFNSLDLKITIEQFLILFYLRKKNKITQKKLCEILGKDKSNFSRMIDFLVKKEFIEKNTVKIKGKQTKEINITEKGIEIIEVAEPLLKEIENLALDGISNIEIQIFKDVLKKINKNLSN